MGKLLFEAKTPDGKTYQLYDDGCMAGFPDGTIIDKYVDDVKRRERPITGFYDSRFPPLFMRRRLVMAIENDAIGEGLFIPEVAKTLRELADLMDTGKVGNKESEAYLLTGGTLVTLKADDINAVCIRDRTPDTQAPCLVVSHEPEPS